MDEVKISQKDRISTLPDEVLHHIFSFMPLHLVIATSLLSKRWRYLWKFVSVLNLSDPFPLRYIDGEYGEGVGYPYYCDFIDHILLGRENESNIHKLDLKGLYDDICDTLMIDTGEIKRWISFALKHNVQDIHLSCIEDVLPQTFNLACQVKILKLSDLSICISPPSSGELHFSSLILESLTISDCCFHCRSDSALRITAPLLKVLNLCCLRESNNCLDINLDTPILESLRIKCANWICDGCLPNLVTANLPNLVTADIQMEVDEREVDEASEYWNKLLNGIRYAKFLTLDLYVCTMSVGISPATFRCIPNLFENLTCLKLLNWYEHYRSYIAPIEKLLESFPNIETLILEGPQLSFMSGEEEYWQGHQLAHQFMLCHLKTLTILHQHPSRCKGLIAFFEFLIGKATGLEKIVMKEETLSTNNQKELVMFRKKLELLLKASSNVSLSFY